MNKSTTLRYSVEELPIAARVLRDGGLIAFPTETVYGLGANALDPAAIERVFQAKGRPSDNPLIVHVANQAMLESVTTSISVTAQRLIDRFWPGPLTLVMPRHPSLPSSVSAGLATVAVRWPDYPIASHLITLAKVPIVAPSANRSGRPSATTWQAALEDLDDRIEGVVCGPATRIGLESTVVDTTCSPPCVLRHGAVSLEMLLAVLPELLDQPPVDEATALLRSPGLRHRHYQPKAEVRLVPMQNTSQSIRTHDDATATAPKRAWIGLNPPIQARTYHRVELCSSLDQYASRLFDFFRRMDGENIETIDCEAVPSEGLGRALMDRIRRASGRDDLSNDSNSPS